MIGRYATKGVCKLFRDDSLNIHRPATVVSLAPLNVIWLFQLSAFDEHILVHLLMANPQAKVAIGRHLQPLQKPFSLLFNRQPQAYALRSIKTRTPLANG